MNIHMEAYPKSTAFVDFSLVLVALRVMEYQNYKTSTLASLYYHELEKYFAESSW